MDVEGVGITKGRIRLSLWHVQYCCSNARELEKCDQLVCSCADDRIEILLVLHNLQDISIKMIGFCSIE